MARKFGLAVFLAIVAGVALASSAQAATVIGQTGTPDECSGPNFGGEVQLSTAGGLSYNVPFDGTITSWSAATDVSGVQTKLLILQPVSGDTFHVIAKSEFSTFTSTGVQTFPAQIPVQKGQVIGAFGQLCLIATGNPGNQLGSFDGPEPATGTDQSFPGGPPGNAADLSATVEPNQPSNTFSIGAITRNKKKGTATITVNVPNPGELSGSGNGAKVSSASAVTSKSVGAGPAKLLVKAKGKKKKKLNKKGKAKVNVAITYTPTGGSPNTQSVKVKLKKKR